MNVLELCSFGGIELFPLVQIVLILLQCIGQSSLLVVVIYGTLLAISGGKGSVLHLRQELHLPGTISFIFVQKFINDI
jgi:hypothetical protein